MILFPSMIWHLWLCQYKVRTYSRKQVAVPYYLLITKSSSWRTFQREATQLASDTFEHPFAKFSWLMTRSPNSWVVASLGASAFVVCRVENDDVWTSQQAPGVWGAAFGVGDTTAVGEVLYGWKHATMEFEIPWFFRRCLEDQFGGWSNSYFLLTQISSIDVKNNG